MNTVKDKSDQRLIERQLLCQMKQIMIPWISLGGITFMLMVIGTQHKRLIADQPGFTGCSFTNIRYMLLSICELCIHPASGIIRKTGIL